MLENWIFTHRRMKLDPYLTWLIKINSKWIKDNVRPETIKHLEKKPTEIKLPDMGLGNDFLDVTPFRLQATKLKINKWNYTELKASAQQKKLSKKIYRMGENTCK